jgi:cytochrome c-type biogenesis protein CcmH/NrfG
MNHKSMTLIRLSIGAVVGGAALLWSGQLPLDSQSSLVSSAEARIGRPLTPMSYAGVARRTTRRAVVGGAVVGGAVAAGAYYAAPAYAAPCSQVVDAYGRIVTVCP